MTEYVVLRSAGGSWTQVGTAAASSGDGAIRQIALHYADGADDWGGSEFVAVPLRSWKPKPVGLEQQTRLKIG